MSDETAQWLRAYNRRRVARRFARLVNERVALIRALARLNGMRRPTMSELEMRADELFTEHIGMRVFGVPGIAGWEAHLVLQGIECRDGQIRLMFRWDDDPSSANTRRGEFAIGVIVWPDTRVTVHPAPAFAEADE